MSAPIRVLVADDQAPFRKAARVVLAASPDFELVGEASSGEQAIEAAATLEPDLVLMDVQMAGIGGIEATRQILAARPESVVVLVSSYRPEDLGVVAADSGALGFVPKNRFDAGALRALWSSRVTLRAPTGTGAQPSRGD